MLEKLELNSRTAPHHQAKKTTHNLLAQQEANPKIKVLNYSNIVKCFQQPSGSFTERSAQNRICSVTKKQYFQAFYKLLEHVKAG